MADTNVFTFNDANYEQEVLQSSGPVLVDLYADWCPPCQMIAPTIEALADEYAGKVRVGKLNVDENPRVARKLGVRSIPALLVYRDGEVVERFVGVTTRDVLARALDAA